MWGMPDVTRRVFLSASAALQVAAPKKLRAGLIGVGSRGRQAVNDLLTGAEDVEVVAMADIFEDQLEKNLKWLKNDKRNAAIAARCSFCCNRMKPIRNHASRVSG